MKNKHQAFTFIELLIAFTIFSIIAASIYCTFSSGIKFYSRGNSLIKANQELRIFFDTVSSELRNAVDYHPYFESNWQSDSITFSALINIFDQGQINKQLSKLSYSLEDDKVIRRSAGLKEGFNTGKAEAQLFLEGVEELSFEYAYEKVGFVGEYEWKNEWKFEGQSAKIPRGIRIKLSLRVEADGPPEKFTKTVFIALGKLGSKITG